MGSDSFEGALDVARGIAQDYRTAMRAAHRIFGFGKFASSHSIFVWSSGVFTLIAAWQEVEAAILDCRESMEMA